MLYLVDLTKKQKEIRINKNKGTKSMGVKRSQIQNLIIYIGDVFGITIGYFLMSHIRFYSDIYGVWAQDNRVIYRWLVAIFVLTIVYLVIDPNQ